MSFAGIQPSTAFQSEAETVGRLLELIRGYVTSQITASMALLSLADELAQRPRMAADLASTTGADQGAMLRFLRAAASIGLLEEVGPQRFSLTHVGAWLGSRADGSSLREVAIGLAGPGLVRPFEQLTAAVLSGRPTAQEVLGTSLWEHFAAHPDEGAHFAGAMSELSASAAEQLVARYDVSGCERIVDLGGGRGAVLARLLEAAPHAHGVLFDRPEVIAAAQATFARRGLAERVELVAGDFFEGVPADGDLYVLRTVLHNWDDEHAAQLLNNCRRAARPASTLLVMEVLLPERAEPSVAFILDLTALVAFGGRERTRHEYERLLAGADYRLERVTAALASALPWSLLVARRSA
jgi:SAM-dependent methyltransferase